MPFFSKLLRLPPALLCAVILDENAKTNLLDLRNKEALLTNTLVACLERGKVENEALKKGKELLDKYSSESPSFEFKASIEAEIYLSNNDVEKALEAVIEGAKIKKIFSSQEYARLYFLFIRIGNQIDLNLDTLENVQENTFVKLKDKDQWYFIGNENELDALLINKANNKFSLFIDKHPKDPVIFEGKYSSENYASEIDLIFTIEKYLLWQTIKNFQRLAKEGDLEGVEMIEVPQKEDTIDPQNLLKLFQDLDARTEPLFEIYCKNNVPMAMLAISEGGLASAIGRIQQESKGFIKFSSGTIEELDKQKEVAKKIISGKMSFYLDGTSALFLSESGMLQKIHDRLPNLKVPQSVLILLAEITEVIETFTKK